MEDLEKYCNKLIKNLPPFVGNYQQEYIPLFDCCKDAIELQETAEPEVLKKLARIKAHVLEDCVGFKTSNLVLASAKGRAKIYTRVPDGFPFGFFWFKINSVKIDPLQNELIFEIKIRKRVEDHQFFYETTEQLEEAEENEMGTQLELLPYFLALGGSLKFTAQFSLQLLGELSNLIEALTPLILGFFDVIAKIIGGCFILLAMVWKSLIPLESGRYRQIRPADYHRMPQLLYKQRQRY